MSFIDPNDLICSHCGESHSSVDHDRLQFEQDGGEHLKNYSYDVEAIDSSSGLPNYINDLTSGYDWDGSGGLNYSGGKITVSYTFTNLDGHWGAQGATNYTALTSVQQAGVRNAMDEFENVADIEFVESSTSSANMIFRVAELPSGIAGWAFYPWYGKSDITFDNAYSTYTEGEFGHRLAMHEIGHAVGLMHPEDTGYSANYDNDGTVMSYYGGSTSYYGHYSKTLQIFDIATLQETYGANTDYNSGNTTYEIDGTNERFTIWDGGGSDTIDASSYSGNSNINLNAGEDIVSQVGNTDFWFAYDADVEDVSAGSGNDVIMGNELANALYGGAGNDTITGGAGDDDIMGNSGADTITAGDGDDTVSGGNDNDTINGNSGADTILGGGGDDTIAGDDGNDILKGHTGDDTITGGNDNDQIFGGGGDDTIAGDDGDDVISGGGDDDNIKGNVGDDIISGDSGDDTISGGSGNDDIKGNLGIDNIMGGDGDDTISGGGGNDDVQGNLGNDTVLGGGGDDTISGGGGNDNIKGHSGDDTITGGGDNDTINGGGGNDTIDGESGIDSLNGGGGLDIFVFSDLADSTNSATDTILDFVQGSDLIDLSAFSFTSISDFTVSKVGGETTISDSVASDSFAITFSGDYDLLNSDFIFA